MCQMDSSKEILSEEVNTHSYKQKRDPLLLFLWISVLVWGPGLTSPETWVSCLATETLYCGLAFCFFSKKTTTTLEILQKGGGKRGGKKRELYPNINLMVQGSGKWRRQEQPHTIFHLGLCGRGRESRVSPCPPWVPRFFSLLDGKEQFTWDTGCSLEQSYKWLIVSRKRNSVSLLSFVTGFI